MCEPPYLEIRARSTVTVIIIVCLLHDEPVWEYNKIWSCKMKVYTIEVRQGQFMIEIEQYCVNILEF